VQRGVEKGTLMLPASAKTVAADCGMRGESIRPAIDLPTVLERVEDDRELLRELVQLFLDDVPLRMRAIHDAVDSRDAEGLQRSAHALKGSAGNLAALAVFEAARELERTAPTGDWTHAQEACAALESELRRLTPVLVKLMAAEPA
jgi:HPt (histidine-containing phosphotransfer) domain-containing protein